MHITAAYPHDAALAQALWDDRRHRECRLAATMLYPAAGMPAGTAIQWACDVQSIEEADVLCHRLLRHTASASDLWRQLLHSDHPLVQYTALRLLLNLLIMHHETDTDAIRSALAHAHIASFPAITALRKDIEQELSEQQ